eukprot:TRINITY_DN7245_c0_g1_i2.p1 TRINITY_DN7245_c0_g1~~TRINITY_DN7245_c0_g1_i2.p1  ORF type:complete len:384 (+),score=120.53 TRINITY_DN7245_c0_g1_i2:554-1705(+)
MEEFRESAKTERQKTYKLEALLREFEEKNVELQERNTWAETEIEALMDFRAKYRQQNEKVHDLENQNRMLASQNESHKTKVAELDAKNTDLQNTVDRLKKLSDETQKELTALKKVSKELKSGDASKTHSIKLLQFELNELQNKYQELQRDIEMERQTRDTNYTMTPKYMEKGFMDGVHIENLGKSLPTLDDTCTSRRSRKSSRKGSTDNSFLDETPRYGQEIALPIPTTPTGGLPSLHHEMFDLVQTDAPKHEFDDQFFALDRGDKGKPQLELDPVLMHTRRCTNYTPSKPEVRYWKRKFMFEEAEKEKAKHPSTNVSEGLDSKLLLAGVLMMKAPEAAASAVTSGYKKIKSAVSFMLNPPIAKMYFGLEKKATLGRIKKQSQ